MQKTSPLVFYIHLQIKQCYHLLQMEEMKCEQTVRQQNTSTVMVLHALPEAWREEAQQGEMAWPEVTTLAELEMQCTSCT